MRHEALPSLLSLTSATCCESAQGRVFISLLSSLWRIILYQGPFVLEHPGWPVFSFSAKIVRYLSLEFTTCIILITLQKGIHLSLSPTVSHMLVIAIIKIISRLTWAKTNWVVILIARYQSGSGLLQILTQKRNSNQILFQTQSHKHTSRSASGCSFLRSHVTMFSPCSAKP